jgi:proteasome assembly chaperone (PAC2) family protein
VLPSRIGVNVIYSSNELPDIHSSYLICGFPGSGYVGKIAVDHLIQELKAIHLADIYSTSFPPQVLIRMDGTAELMKNSIFYSQNSDTNLLLLTIC